MVTGYRLVSTWTVFPAVKVLLSMAFMGPFADPIDEDEAYISASLDG